MTDTTCKILIGDVRAKLRELEDESIQCVVTSPPYWGLRDYGTEPQVWGGRADCVHEWGAVGKIHRGGPPGKSEDMAGRDQSARAATGDIKTGCFCGACGAWRGELGLEPTPELFVEHVVEVFREVKRVLKKDGTCWVNMGDCYATGTNSERKPTTTTGENVPSGWSKRCQAVRMSGTSSSRGSNRPDANGRGETQIEGYRGDRAGSMGKHGYREDFEQPNRKPIAGLKPKDLVGQPWRVAFGLQADGWWLRQDIIWAKPNPMPESIRDRCTKSHEYLFLLTKSARYYFDAKAIKEPVTGGAKPRGQGNNRKVIPAGWAVGPGSHSAIDHNKGEKGRGLGFRVKQNESFSTAIRHLVELRNKRSVWTIPTEPYPEAHYATYPTALVRPCVLAGTKPGDVVLDPFGGSGTTAAVALALGRSAVLIDLNPANEAFMRARIARGMRNPKAKKLRKCETIEMRLEGAA